MPIQYGMDRQVLISIFTRWLNNNINSRRYGPLHRPSSSSCKGLLAVLTAKQRYTKEEKIILDFFVFCSNPGNCNIVNGNLRTWPRSLALVCLP